VVEVRFVVEMQLLQLVVRLCIIKVNLELRAHLPVCCLPAHRRMPDGGSDAEMKLSL